MKHRLFIIVCLMLLWSTSAAHANLSIEITRGSDQAIPLGVVPLANNDAFDHDISKIISDNLERSGVFAPLARESMFDRPSQFEQVRFGNWQSLDVRYLVIGRVTQQGDQANVEASLIDISGQTRLFTESVQTAPDNLRAAAHRLSDRIYEEITGTAGAFSTRIAYIASKGVGDNTEYGLYVADADGRNSQEILSSAQPIMSPSWSPDGKKLAYVSFESGQSAIYVQEVASGRRLQLTDFEGLNSAPAWSPDGRRLAMSLSKDGNPDIYIMDLADRSLNRITSSSSIDTEPEWAPDSSALLFTSDRSGGPQIYRHRFSGDTERLTFTGNYNARARLTPDGEQVFMIHRSERGFQIARLSLDNDRLVIISDSTRDESPSVAPNGSMVIFATHYQGQEILSAVSADGRSAFRLPAADGDVRDPVWSPITD